MKEALEQKEIREIYEHCVRAHNDRQWENSEIWGMIYERKIKEAIEKDYIQHLPAIESYPLIYLN